jgi:hypothetical protein
VALDVTLTLREVPRAFRKSFRGQLQTDGYGVCESLGEGRAVAWLVGQDRPALCRKQLREQNAGPQLRAAVRAWQRRRPPK